MNDQISLTLEKPACNILSRNWVFIQARLRFIFILNLVSAYFSIFKAIRLNRAIFSAAFSR